MRALIFAYKGARFLWMKFLMPIDWLMSYLLFNSNDVKYSSFRNIGWPIINVGIGGSCKIGPGFCSNNREMSNPIGRFKKCSIIVGNNGKLTIGANVGMSSTAIVCYKSIKIGDNVKIGGNVVIYDTDFHSLSSKDRMNFDIDRQNTSSKPIIIKDNVLIGAHSTILKGVIIGSNVVIGACSVITKNVPDDQIWAGNPARFIRIND
ncbi:acyltransferase [Ulvibacterium marinum]|uniref:Acyltransferase n=1 Tax=Ulvibacterium marinum TaxID=2419782 RepID=A0A3B0C2R6_9FLAO|nr:acyltransferase [Ulvibacterium marinum]RKN79762.1 acyltransferase [Ulvibacterium marinum]